jgi:hypothetical protein
MADVQSADTNTMMPKELLWSSDKDRVSLHDHCSEYRKIGVPVCVEGREQVVENYSPT